MSDDEEQQRQKAGGVTEKMVDAARDSVRFLAGFAEGPLEQASGMLTDHLRYVRWERQVRLRERAQQFMTERGLSGPTRAVSLKILVPLVEEASLEENDDLQDVWARLLVNAADAKSGVDIQRSFITILADMSPLDAQCLVVLYERDQGPELPMSLELRTVNLPTGSERGTYGIFDEPPEQVNVALWNLIRLGCLAPGTRTAQNSLFGVSLTPLGRALYRAVQPPTAPM